MEYSTSVCPVPDEQQPINEYQELRESWFFSWATHGWMQYVKPFVILWSLSWLIAGPVAATSFPVAKYPLKFFFSGAAGAMLVPLLTLIHLYSGWGYISDRLQKETIFYEESGWYDGQTWTKPDQVLQRDRLIVAYEIKPILLRLKQTFVLLAVVFLGCTIAWVVP